MSLHLHPIQPGIQQAELLPAHCEHRIAPANLVLQDTALFSHEFERRFEPCRVVAIDQVSLLNHSWLQKQQGCFVDGFRPWHGPRRRKRGRLRDLIYLVRPGKQFDEVIWAHDDWSGNYFHWLTDVLPKLMAWRQEGLPNLPVLLPADCLLPSYVAESLERLGFSMRSFAQHERIEITRLWVIEPTAPTGNFRAALLNHLRSRLINGSSNSKADGSDSPHKIYISRRDSQRRCLRNEAELEAVLEEHRVKPVLLEGRPLANQINMFSQCGLLVGLHGAGLTNMLWMPAGGEVIEIRRRGDAHNNCYYAMADALGHRYSYILAESIDPDLMNQNSDLILDSMDLRVTLQSTLQRMAS